MELTILRNISIMLAVFGLVLIYWLSPSQFQAKTSIAEIRRDCSGPVAVHGTVGNISYSSNGNLIAELSQNRSRISLFLDQGNLQEGSKAYVFGRASKFSNQCWIFPDRIEIG